MCSYMVQLSKLPCLCLISPQALKSADLWSAALTIYPLLHAAGGPAGGFKPPYYDHIDRTPDVDTMLQLVVEQVICCNLYPSSSL